MTLANGVLSVSNVLSDSKTSSQVITVTAKPAESTLRSTDGKPVTVAAPADVIELTMSTSLGDVPTKCATTAVQLNQTTVKAAAQPEPGDPPANKDPQGSSTDSIASFFKKIFGIDKSDEGKNTAKTFWLSFFGSGLLAVIISAVLNFIR